MCTYLASAVCPPRHSAEHYSSTGLTAIWGSPQLPAVSVQDPSRDQQAQPDAAPPFVEDAALLRLFGCQRFERRRVSYQHLVTSWGRSLSHGQPFVADQLPAERGND